MKVYLAGKMTREPQFNIPLFDKWAYELREQGFDVVSPAEEDGPELRALALASKTGDPAGIDHHSTWGDMLARDVKIIADGGIEGVVVLPGWAESRGARLETFVASALLGLPIMEGNGLTLVSPERLLLAWGKGLVR